MDSRPCWLTRPASSSSKCSRVAQWVRLVMFAEPPTASTMHAAITAGVAFDAFATVPPCCRMPLCSIIGAGCPKSTAMPAKHRETATMRYGAPRWCPAIMFRDDASPHPFSVFAAAPIPTSFHHAESCNRCQKSSFLPPIRSVATEKVVSYLSHTLRSRVVTQNEARPGVTWNLRIVICEFHVVPGLFLFSGDFRQSKPDLACGRGATRQARPVNGERTRQ